MSSKRKEHGEDGGSAVDFNPKTREVYLIGGVGPDTVKSVIPAMREMDRKKGPVHLIVSSTGGAEGSGWALFDTIRLMSNPVYGHAIGECQSIAALILQACPLRLMSENCRFMVHNGSVEMAVTVTQLRSYAQEALTMTSRYYEALAERSGLTVAKVRGLCNRETYLSAQECLKLGFIDGILAKAPERKKRSK